jgi:uncharacterized membrane protein YkvA (DUF1232 family)
LNDSQPGSPSTGKGRGFFDGLSLRIRLVLRLLRDPRVNPLLKLLPIGAVLYLVIPEPIIGPIDDAFILWLGSTLFVELCPQEIVQEHWEALTSIIDAEWREIKDSEHSNTETSE